MVDCTPACTRKNVITRSLNLARQLDVTQPLLSHHLGLLRQSELVHARKEGRRRYYGLQPDRIDGLIRYLNEICTRFKRSTK
jgi:DNA-binding transcriptional ArsR family regulator